MSSNQETTSEKFDALYRNAAKVFAAQSLAVQFDSAQAERNQDVAYATISKSTSGDSYQITQAWGGAVDTTPWVQRHSDVNIETSGGLLNTWTDWYDQWYYQFPRTYENHYHFTQPDIKKILEEIRDSIKPATNKLSKDLVSSNWPPSDVSIDRDGSLVIDVALAGYSRDDIDVSIEGDKLVVEFKLAESSSLSPIQSGIKKGDGRIEFFVDPEKFSMDGIRVTFEACILRVLFQRIGERPLKKLVIEE